MKKITNAEVRVINMNACDILTTSALSVGDPITSGTVQGSAPARTAVFDAPATDASAQSNTIWQ